MSASYPTSTKSFTTKVDGPGHTISASHVNDLQDEVVAIENGLRAGLAHDLLFTDATYDIGKSGATRPRDLFLSRNAVVGGTLAVTGAATLASLVLSSGQLAFPATQAPSADVNTLDDYEEGTFTPVIGGSGGTSGQTYAAQVGRYVKIGRRVCFQIYVGLSAKGTITTAVQIQGLPFASENTANQYAVCAVWFNSLNTNWVHVVAYVNPNATTMDVVGTQAAAASMTSLVTADITNSTALMVAGTYMAAA